MPMIATQSCRRHGSRLQQPWPGWGHQGQHQLRDAKSGRCGRYTVLFFSAGANFWAILGHFWAILAILGHVWAILGNFRSFLGHFLVLIFLWQNMHLCYLNRFLQLCKLYALSLLLCESPFYSIQCFEQLRVFRNQIAPLQCPNV